MSEQKRNDLNRRDLLRVLGASAVGAALPIADAEAKAAAIPLPAAAGSTAAAPAGVTFFTPHELETVTLLGDLIIPRDDRSGSASDAGGPAFLDFWMTDHPDEQDAMRGGLAWLDRECHDRWGKTFVACSDGERTALLDLIAFPRKAPPELSQGVAFFNSFRDYVASGFFTSRMGVQDLQYTGNVPVGSWNGCPPEVLRKLGVEGES